MPIANDKMILRLIFFLLLLTNDLLHLDVNSITTLPDNHKLSVWCRYRPVSTRECLDPHATAVTTTSPGSPVEASVPEPSSLVLVAFDISRTEGIS